MAIFWSQSDSDRGLVPEWRKQPDNRELRHQRRRIVLANGFIWFALAAGVLYLLLEPLF